MEDLVLVKRCFFNPWVISEGNGFTQFKPVKNTGGKEVPTLSSKHRFTLLSIQ